MSLFAWSIALGLVVMLIAALRFNQKRRRGDAVAALIHAVSELGRAVGRDNTGWELRDIAAGKVRFEKGTRTVIIDATRLLTIMANEDTTHRNMQLRLLWSQAENVASDSSP